LVPVAHRSAGRIAAMSEQAPSRLRLFIAVMMAEQVRAEIGQAQAELRRALAASRISWTKREQLHLTLKFLGHVEASRSGLLEEAIRKACRGFAPMSLRAQGIGTFPHRPPPRVIWVGVQDGQEVLPRLHGVVADATHDFAAEKPEKEFT